jgi:type II secretion system protein N
MDNLRIYFLNPLINVFKFHKFKIFFVFLMTLVFYILFFPYYQLSGLIESQISKASRGQTQVSFNDLSLSLMPFGISAKNVSIFTPQMPSPLFIEKAYIRPSIADLLRFKKGGVLIAENIWGGNLTFQFSDLGQGNSKNKEAGMINLKASFSDINLNKLASWYKAPFNTKGTMSGQFDITLDQKAFEQPIGQFQIKGSKVQLPSSVKVMQMDLLLPEGGFKTIDIKGKLAAGQFNLLESTLGVPSDVIYGKLKGSMGLTFISLGGRLSPRPSQYDFAMDLNLDKKTEQKIGTLLTTVLLNGKGGKSPTVDGGARYLLSVKGYPGSNPNIEPLAIF